jgi:hypothetical protein
LIVRGLRFVAMWGLRRFAVVMGWALSMGECICPILL